MDTFGSYAFDFLHVSKQPEAAVAVLHNDVLPFYRNLDLPVGAVLTDNGIQFADQPRNRNTAYSRQMRFDMICEANGIEHRLTKPNHPWTNGQVERMNRTIKEATVKRFHGGGRNGTILRTVSRPRSRGA